MNFAVIPNLTRVNAFAVTCDFLNEAEKLGCHLYFENKDYKTFGDYKFIEFCDIETMMKKCDALVSVGGDGSFINAAKIAMKYNKPVICINAGKLAYLACLEKNDIHLLKNICEGKYKTEKRMVLEASVIKNNGEVIYHSNCINDAVVSRSGNIRIMKLSVSCNASPLIQYMADGVIVSTPTGSTAYSLSAGGPIIEPSVSGLLVTPVCSHTVFSRPIVLRDDSVLEITHDNSGEAVLSCDGKKPVIIPPDCKVTVKRSDVFAEFIKVKDETFIDVLNKKLSS